MTKNPFPGLRSFEYHEHELFFGRDEQYEQMIAKLSETRFLAVVGTSGSGKSSLVKAGLYPALYGGLMMSAGPSWRIAEFRPKDDPIRELALALNHKRVFGDRSKENGSSLFGLSESTNWTILCSRIKEAKQEERNPSGRILKMLSPTNRTVLSEGCGDKDVKEIVQVFNGILRTRDFYEPTDFNKVHLSNEIQELLTRDRKSLSNGELEKLNRLLLEASFPEIARKIESQAQLTEVSLRRGDLGLIEVVREAKMSPDENLLVVVDQFEELFRYAKISEHGPHGNQAAAFVKLLLQASAQTELPIYVVLTMRSDYLGDCAKFWALPEAINKGQYLIPRLTRDQRREAIMGPVGLRGAKITAQLVNQLLNDMGDDPDQLPILQHALMRTWDRWEQDHNSDKPIDLDHYEAIGRMAEALSIHADEAFEELPDERSKEIAEKIFKSLTERGTGHVETRRPTKMSELLDVTNAKFRELVPILDVFRKEGRSFLLPSPTRHLRRETLIDISHESLIRNWKRMKTWVNREAESANVYRRLVQTAKLYRQGRAGTLTDLEVDYALRWKRDNKPNLTWASRYHLELIQDRSDLTQKAGSPLIKDPPVVISDKEIYEGAMGFLDASKRTARLRKLSKVLVAASVIFVVSWALISRIRNIQEANLVKAALTYSAEINLAQRELEAGNFAEVNRVLHNPEDVKEQRSLFIPFSLLSPTKISSLRDFEWSYLWKLTHNEASTLVEYKNPVISVAYLNRFNTVAVATRGGEIMLWDVAQNKVLANPTGGPQNLTSVTFASDRKNIVIAKPDGSIGSWELSDDLQSLTLRSTLRGAHPISVTAIAYSPDDSFLAFGTQDGTVTLLRRGERQSLPDLPLQPAGPVSLTFSSDSSLLAIGQNQTVIVVEIATKSKLEIDLNTTLPAEVRKREPPQRAAPVTCIAFSPDRNTLAIGTKDNSITLWDLKENRYLNSLVGRSLNGGSWEMLALAFSDEAKGVLASASTDGSLNIWNAKTFSAPGFQTNLSGGLVPLTLAGHAGAVTSIAFTLNQDAIISGSEDGTVKSWVMAPKQNRDQLSASSAVVSALAFSPNGKWLAAGNVDASVKVWDTSDKQSNGHLLVSPRSGNSQMGMPIAFSKDDVLAAATDKSVTCWQMNNLAAAPRILSGGHSAPILALAFSPDGKVLATGGLDNTVRLWNVQTGEWSPDGIQVGGAILSLAFSPNERILAVVTIRNNVILWHLDEAKVIAVLQGHSDLISSVAFSSDGKLIATGSWDRNAKLWDAHTGQELTTLHGHSKKVLSVAFFPGGKRLVTGSEDGSVRLWDTSYKNVENAREALMTLRDERFGAVSVVATSPDGLTLATGTATGTVVLRYGATKEEIAKQTQVTK